VSSRLDALVDRDDPYAPFIDLKGGKQVESEVQEIFREPGFIASSLFDGDLTSQVVIDSKVNNRLIGQYTVTYLVEDSNGRQASEIRRVRVSDTRAPVITLAGTNPFSVERSQSFVEPGFQAIDAYDLAPTFSSIPQVNTDLIGVYRVDYFASDASGNQARSIREVRVLDTMIPLVIMSQPLIDSGFFSRVTVTGSCELHSQTSGVRITGDILNSPIETPCLADGTYQRTVDLSLGEGIKLIRASQTDGGGNIGEVSRRVRRGKTLEILLPAPNTNTASSITLSGQCTSGSGVSMVSFSSSIENNGIVPRPSVVCVADTFSAQIQLRLGTGSRNVIVRQTDANGENSQVFRDFNIDSESPDVLITAPSAGAAFHREFTLQGSCDSSTGAEDVIISGEMIQLSPVNTSCANSQFSQRLFFTGGSDTIPSSEEVLVTQRDGIGNIGTDRRSFQHGLGLAIMAPAANTPNNGQSAMIISGRCSTAPGVVRQVRFTGGIQPSTAGVTCVPSDSDPLLGSFSGQAILSGGDQGARLVWANQVDAAGVDGASSSRQFQLDTQAPAVTILTPTEGLRTRLVGQTISGVCETSNSGSFRAEPLELTGDVVGAPFNVDCNNGIYSRLINLNSGDGPKVLRIRQRDFAGTYSSQIARNLILDTIPPNLTFTSPMADRFFQNSIPIVAGTCDSADGGSASQIRLEVLENGTPVGAPILAACSSSGPTINTFSFAGVNLSGPDGVRTLRVKRTDLAGNEQSIGRNITRDTTPPVITLSRNVGEFHSVDLCDSSLGLSATATDNLDSSPDVQNPDFSNFFYIKGDLMITFAATDRAGNQATRDVLVKVRRLEAGFDFDRGIYNRISLDAMRSDLSLKYFVCQDIDLQNVQMDSIGRNGNNQGFSGVLYAGGHSSLNRPFKIANFTNNNGADENSEGLFDRIENSGVVQHIALEGFFVSGQKEVGALAGVNNGLIKQVVVMSANITSSESTSNSIGFGGLVGINRSRIEESFVESSQISGPEKVGGLVGILVSSSGPNGNSGSISNSFVAADVNVEAQEKLGGLVGYVEGESIAGSIFNSYSRAPIDIDGENSRALIGFNDVEASVTSSYFEKGRDEADPEENYGTPLDEIEFKAQASFVGWDFFNLWVNEEGVSIPRLRWLP